MIFSTPWIFSTYAYCERHGAKYKPLADSWMVFLKYKLYEGSLQIVAQSKRNNTALSGRQSKIIVDSKTTKLTHIILWLHTDENDEWILQLGGSFIVNPWLGRSFFLIPLLRYSIIIRLLLIFQYLFISETFFHYSSIARLAVHH